MQTQIDNGVSLQEVGTILEHVQQAIVEHKNMLKTAEMYLERNGIKQEYTRYLEGRLAEAKVQDVNRDISKREKTEQESVKKVKKIKGR